MAPYRISWVRGGSVVAWCPGREVYPFVVDITDDVALGADATVSYRGLYQAIHPVTDTEISNTTRGL